MVFYLSVQNVTVNPLLNKIKCLKIIWNLSKNIGNKNTFLYILNEPLYENKHDFIKYLVVAKTNSYWKC